MATQIVMDRTGDTRHNFDAKNADALLKAEERFRELTGAGFTAAVRTASGETVVKRTFDPNAEETLFGMGLTLDIGGGSIMLGIQRVELLIESMIGRDPGINRAADRLYRRWLHGRASIVDRSS